MVSKVQDNPLDEKRIYQNKVTSSVKNKSHPYNLTILLLFLHNNNNNCKLKNVCKYNLHFYIIRYLFLKATNN